MSPRSTATRPGRVRRALVTGLALAGLASFSLVAGLAAQSARAADEDPQLTGAPAVGSCYDASYAQGRQTALSQQSFDCNTRIHTMWVVGVSKIPERYRNVTPDSKELVAWIHQTCQAAFDQSLGTNMNRRLRSLVQGWNFLPTQAQIDAGARWASCTLSIVDEGQLHRSRTVRFPSLKAGIPNEVAWCLRAGQYDRPCVRTHTHRAVWATVVYRKPTEANMRSAGYTCRNHVRNFRYSRYYTWKRSASSFNLVCFEPTKS